MCNRCEYQLDDEDDAIESPIEHPDVTKAREEDQAAIHHAFGDDDIIWYRQGGRCFDCGKDAWPPIAGQMGSDRNLRCYGCAATFMMRELREMGVAA